MKNLKDRINESLLDNVGVRKIADIKTWCEKVGVSAYKLDEEGGIVVLEANEKHNQRGTVVDISDEDLVDGQLPYKFSKSLSPKYSMCDLEFHNCKTLTSLEGCPEIVSGCVEIVEYPALTTLVGGPNPKNHPG